MNPFKIFGILTGAGLIVWFFQAIIIALLGGWLFPYSIEFWAKVAHHLVVVPFWAGAVLGLIPLFRWIMIPLALLTWICHFIIIVL